MPDQHALDDPTLGGVLGPRPATPLNEVHPAQRGGLCRPLDASPGVEREPQTFEVGYDTTPVLHTEGSADYGPTDTEPFEVRQVERLTFEPGDTLLVRASMDLPLDVAEKLTEALSAGFPGVHIVLVDELTDLTVADPEQMRAAGWVRADDGSAQ